MYFELSKASYCPSLFCNQYLGIENKRSTYYYLLSLPYDLGEDFPNEMTGPKMTTTESKKQLFMTYQNEIYYFKCRSSEDCYWEQKNYQLQIKRSFHVMMEVPPSLVENC